MWATQDLSVRRGQGCSLLHVAPVTRRAYSRRMAAAGAAPAYGAIDARHRPVPARAPAGPHPRRRARRVAAAGPAAGRGGAVVVAGGRHGARPGHRQRAGPPALARGRGAADGVAPGPGHRRPARDPHPRRRRVAVPDGRVRRRRCRALARGRGPRTDDRRPARLRRGRPLDRARRRHERHRHGPGRGRSGRAVLRRALRAGPAPLVLHRDAHPRPADGRAAGRGRRQRPGAHPAPRDRRAGRELGPARRGRPLAAPRGSARAAAAQRRARARRRQRAVARRRRPRLGRPPRRHRRPRPDPGPAGAPRARGAGARALPPRAARRRLAGPAPRWLGLGDRLPGPHRGARPRRHQRRGVVAHHAHPEARRAAGAAGRAPVAPG